MARFVPGERDQRREGFQLDADPTLAGRLGRSRYGYRRAQPGILKRGRPPFCDG